MTVARNYLINKATEAALTPVMTQAMTYAAAAGVSPTYLQIGMLAMQTSGLVKAAKMRGGGAACFVAGTGIAVGSAQDGTLITRAIEDIKVGDLVLARDQYDAADDLDLRRVSQVFVRQTDHLRTLVIEGDEGNIETLQTTDEHPFYVQGRGWLDAGEVRKGDLVQEADGTWQTVLSSVREDHATGITVYNIEVEGDHTYFVDDGVGAMDAVWVHNAPKCNGAGDYLGTYKNKPRVFEGVKLKERIFTKRTDADLVSIRTAFTAGGASSPRQTFLRDLGDKANPLSQNYDPAVRQKLIGAKLTKQEIASLLDGDAPANFQVHHKVPLEFGGDNNQSNLMLLQSAEARPSVNYHSPVTADQIPLRDNHATGESFMVEWPDFPGFIYP